MGSRGASETFWKSVEDMGEGVVETQRTGLRYPCRFYVSSPRATMKPIPVTAERAETGDAAPAQPAGEFVSFPDSPFQLFQPYPPAGDQPEAIAALVEGVRDGLAYQTLLGVTGSGKTYTMAHVIARLGRPAIVFAPNKTLAAQLYSEFREFFPKNAVEYFVSYYDYPTARSLSSMGSNTSLIMN